MFSALVGDKPQFVHLLLDNGVSLRHFLQEEDTLCELYNRLPSGYLLRKLAKRVKNDRNRWGKMVGIRSRPSSMGGTVISMAHVSEEVHHLLGRFTQPLYPLSTTRYSLHMDRDDTEDTSVSVSGIYSTVAKGRHQTLLSICVIPFLKTLN